MEVRQLRNLRAELAYLDSLIERTPEANVLDRMSLEARKEQVEAELAGFEDAQTDIEPTRLTFHGKPVIGQHGITTGFGATVVGKFADAVEAMGASSKQTLGSRGSIPRTDNHEMIITGIVRGSFGFQFERAPDQLLMLTELDPVVEAVDKVKAIMEATLATDDELAQTLADTDERVTRKVKEFLDVLVDNEATCSIEAKRREFRFNSVDEVRRGSARLREDNIIQREVILTGSFIGYLPESRQAEIRVNEISEDDAEFLGEIEDTVVKAKVDPSIEDAETINANLDADGRIVLQSRRVGQGKPTFTVIDPGLELVNLETDTSHLGFLISDDPQPFDENPS